MRILNRAISQWAGLKNLATVKTQINLKKDKRRDSATREAQVSFSKYGQRGVYT